MVSATRKPYCPAQPKFPKKHGNTKNPSTGNPRGWCDLNSASTGLLVWLDRLPALKHTLSHVYITAADIFYFHPKLCGGAKLKIKPKKNCGIILKGALHRQLSRLY